MANNLPLQIAWHNLILRSKRRGGGSNNDDNEPQWNGNPIWEILGLIVLIIFIIFKFCN